MGYLFDIEGIAYRVASTKSRGICCLKKTHKSVTDGKDHYPINSVSQARNALSRVMQHDAVPEWFSGTLQSLRNTVKRCVQKNYPSIEVEITPKRKPKK